MKNYPNNAINWLFTGVVALLLLLLLLIMMMMMMNKRIGMPCKIMSIGSRDRAHRS